jgi:hypothetical protein
MKQAKVKLIRQMRSENERFRSWKQEREKELIQLRIQDRRRQNEMARMERLHTKQQNVLKRKVEEAAAVNKRLKVGVDVCVCVCARARVHAGGEARAPSSHIVCYNFNISNCSNGCNRTKLFPVIFFSFPN